ncbi:YbjN domain-containing protein [Thiohalocapsa sp. ML1]|jgi:hypothetical protein|uniref:YbjN domain-containing protein n=1 Tax=Thiohalocapsa sp. ML1 TaxID=1431688 RepID=UPI000732437F|nr:YbjN domain-containing protein [Thiohalocapsa sp. ML1]
MTDRAAAGRDGYETLRAYLRGTNWAAAEEPERMLFRARTELDLCPVEYYFRVLLERCEFLFYIVPEIEVPEHLLHAVAEYVCRVNSGMRIGNFELDFGNRHLRFKSSVNFTDTRLTEALIAGAVKPALTAFDEYFIGLARVLAGVATPAQAINDIDYGVP